MKLHERDGEMKKRVFLIVLDSMGIGEMPDAARFCDEGSNTLGATPPLVVRNDKCIGKKHALLLLYIYNMEGNGV